MTEKNNTSLTYSLGFKIPHIMSEKCFNGIFLLIGHLQQNIMWFHLDRELCLFTDYMYRYFYSLWCPGTNS